MKVTSERLFAKPLVENNIDKGWLEWVNDYKVTKYLTIKPPVLKDDLIKKIKKNNQDNDLLLGVYKIINSEYIGNLRIYNINEVDKTGMYGRIIGKLENRNKGYGTEILNIICCIMFEYLKLDYAYTRINKHNAGSKKSNLKIGKLIYPSDFFWENKSPIYDYEVGFVIEKKEWKNYSQTHKVICKLFKVLEN